MDSDRGKRSRWGEETVIDTRERVIEIKWMGRKRGKVEVIDTVVRGGRRA